MSVINKVLRDLDRRGANPTQTGVNPLSGDAPTSASSTPTGGVAWRPRVHTPARRPRPGVPWGLVLAGSALIAAVEFWPWRAPPVAAVFPPAGKAPAAAPVPVPAPAPVATVASEPAPPPEATIDPPATAPSSAPPVAARAQPVVPPAPTAPRPAPAPVPATAQTTVAVAVASPAPAMAATPAASRAVVPNANPSTPPAQAAPAAAAGAEWITQAQSLAQAGALDQALTLLDGAMAQTATGTDTATGLVLLREAVRLALADGRLRAPWAWLQRHEAWLTGQADLWAQRGHIAQRLGEHADSARAYQQALGLRPTEARWQLGAAVSLAALGQTAAAAEWAERARAQGPVAPQVLDYLRQAGVALKP